MDDRTRARFLSRVKIQPNGCRHWTGHVKKDGYGQFSMGGKNVLAHSAGYVLFVGPVPEGLELDHACHTRDKTCSGGPTCLHRRCVFWEHLEPVTRLENVRRGRGVDGDYCRNGHEWTTENIYIDPRGRRECRTCRREWQRDYYRTLHPGARHGTETHCPQNHPYAGDNLIVTKRGSRACRQCKRDSDREGMRRRRARAKDEAAELAFMAEIAVLLGPAPAGELVLF